MEELPLEVGCVVERIGEGHRNFPLGSTGIVSRIKDNGAKLEVYGVDGGWYTKYFKIISGPKPEHVVVILGDIAKWEKDLEQEEAMIAEKTSSLIRMQQRAELIAGYLAVAKRELRKAEQED